MGCARCHDHKYDPITQKEFYQLFAYFNNVPEQRPGDQVRQLAAIHSGTDAATKGAARPLWTGSCPQRRSASTGLAKELAKAQTKWEKTAPANLHWSPTGAQVGHFPLDGPSGQFDGKRCVESADVGNFGFYDKFSLAARVRPSDNRGGTIISRMTDTARADGYGVSLHDGKVFVHLTKRWLDDALRVETERSLPPGEWHHVLVTYDGSRVAAGVRVYIDGRLEKTKVLLDELNQTFASKEPLRIGAGGGPEGRFHGTLADVRVYDDCLSADEAAWLAVPQTVGEIAALPREKRTPFQAGKLRECFLEEHAPSTIRQAYQGVVDLRRRRDGADREFSDNDGYGRDAAAARDICADPRTV